MSESKGCSSDTPEGKESKFGFRFNSPSPDSPLGKAVAASPKRAEAKGDGSMGGMGAGLSMLSLAGVEKGKSGAGDYNDSECKEDEAKALQETEMDTTFILPESVGGGEEQAVFRMGNTVGYLKEHVQQCCEIEVSDQVFHLQDGTVLIDPLTLTDYPQIDMRKGLVIRVEGTPSHKKE